MVRGVLLAIGGQDLSSASKKITSIYALYPIFQTWKYVGDMPFECSLVDSLVYQGDLVVVDGKSGRVVIGKVNGECPYGNMCARALKCLSVCLNVCFWQCGSVSDSYIW